MKKRIIESKFIDSPGLVKLRKTIEHWQAVPLPADLSDALEYHGNPGFSEISSLAFDKLHSIRKAKTRKKLENELIAWLYQFIRINIKRGAVFSLKEVLRTGLADCLGYVKLFTILGRHCGLDVGATEVIIDNGGRIVPHTANLLFLSDKKPVMIDLWYGSTDIKHERISAARKQKLLDIVEDINYADLKNSSYSYLPDYVVDSITLYVEGNRFLKNGNFNRAVELYSAAIYLNYTNSRYYYNRAIALENLGETEKARKDYTRALQDDSSMLRTLATQPDEIVNLTELDELKIPDNLQHIYLLNKGYVTGSNLTPSVIAARLKIPVDEIRDTLNSIKTQLKSM